MGPFLTPFGFSCKCDVKLSLFNFLVFSFRVGELVKDQLKDCDLSMTTTPCSILFPASYGYGLASKVLLNFLVDRHNSILKMLSTEKNVTLESVASADIVDSSMLVSVEGQDLHLALVANSEYNFGVSDSTTGCAKWTLNECGLEDLIVERYVRKRSIDVTDSKYHFYPSFRFYVSI